MSAHTHTNKLKDRKASVPQDRRKVTNASSQGFHETDKIFQRLNAPEPLMEQFDNAPAV